ncbi:hypothetical protein [Nitrobacter sp.]|uniref:hypothetical protein n=1 Tax=Nitrobacter sp. TaxID=29420 RepID=UPI001DC7723B|nr:hypothetical protein [Nitrobacter sp.]MCB1392460.1 hypothetical protein [Nitrobacter sp.]
MLRWAVAMAEVRRGRRAAVTTIGPLVERSRAALNGIPDIAWRDPYLVGFMLTLITIVARIENPDLQDHDLSLVQSQAWGAITGMDADLLGEEALTLSKLHPREFQHGSYSAMMVATRLCGPAVASIGYEPWQVTETLLEPDASAADDSHISRSLSPATGNWADAFDTYIAGLPLAKLP